MARRAGDWNTGTKMPKRFDGSGVVLIQCSESVFAALKLSEMPIPEESGYWENGKHITYMDTRSMGADSQRYRVIWPDRSNGPGSKPRTSSFTLSGSHCNETLYVLAEFLRSQDIDFVGLANRHGNRFKSVGLSGSDLAYLPGYRLHSVLRSCNLFVKPTPEDSAAPGL